MKRMLKKVIGFVTVFLLVLSQSPLGGRFSMVQDVFAAAGDSVCNSGDIVITSPQY